MTCIVFDMLYLWCVSDVKGSFVSQPGIVTVRTALLHFLFRVCFSRHCGENIVLSKDGLTASRVKGYNHGVVLSEGKVPNDKVFEVRGV